MSRNSIRAETSFASPTTRRAPLAATASSRSGNSRADVLHAALLLLALSVAAGSLPGCAHTRTAQGPRAASAPSREGNVLTRDYVAEVIRYLYRWHADETMLAAVSTHTDAELWARRLHPQLDAGDNSRFCEVLFPRVH